MFHKLGGRMIASYALLTLLSIALTAGLALSLTWRYVERGETGYLKANAEAVAQQASRFLFPRVRNVALQDLAAASAFMGNTRVRILGAQGETLADTGPAGAPDEFVWVVPSGLAEIDSERWDSNPYILTLPPRRGADGAEGPSRDSREIQQMLRDFPAGTSHVTVRREDSLWGRRFVFGPDPLPSSKAQGGRGGLFGGLANMLLGGPPDHESSLESLVKSVNVPIPGPAGTPLGSVEMTGVLSFQRDALGISRTALLAAGVLSLAVAVALGLIMTRNLTRPVLSLTSVAERMSGGDLAARAPEARRDELGDLARAFNRMAESLGSSFRQLGEERDSLKRFIADSSHELRTPLTGLSTFIELLQGKASDDPAARAEFLQESGRLLSRMEQITRGLLDLSRLDGGIAALQLSDSDAGDIVRASASPFEALGHDRGIAVEIQVPAAPLPVRCDGERIGIVLTNLLSNALKHTKRGGRVTVGVEAVADASEAAPGAASEAAPGVRIRVEDDGEGIDAEDLPRVFDRFFRGKNGTGDGTGLGLAIVRSIVTAHGGAVRAESRPGSGSRFTVFLPAGLKLDRAPPAA